LPLEGRVLPGGAVERFYVGRELTNRPGEDRRDLRIVVGQFFEGFLDRLQLLDFPIELSYYRLLAPGRDKKQGSPGQGRTLRR
jgi:hypothetical protein